MLYNNHLNTRSTHAIEKAINTIITITLITHEDLLNISIYLLYECGLDKALIIKGMLK